MAHGGLQGKAAMGNPQGGSQRGGLAQGHHAAYDQQPSTIYHYDTIVKSKNKQESLQKMADGESVAPAVSVNDAQTSVRWAWKSATGVPPVLGHGQDGD